jgi:hypothetical protein
MMERLRGLKSLVIDAVEHGSRAIEKVQKETARRPFALLEAIPPIAVPAKGVHLVHDTAVTATHTMIRVVNKVVGETLDVVLDTVEKAQASTPNGTAGREPADPVRDR